MAAATNPTTEMSAMDKQAMMASYEEENGGSTVMQDHWATIAWRKLSYYWAVVLLVFGLVVHINGIIEGNNNSPWDVDASHPAGELIFFLFMLFWISLLEGCQISFVGLQYVDRELYKDSHPRSYQISKLLHEGPNVERFLVGRQFLLLFNGFLVSRVGGGVGVDRYEIGSWEWNSEATDLFWNNSALLMIIIVALGQLPTQLLAANTMLDFQELPFMAYYTVLLPCMLIEKIGICNSTYLLKDFLVAITGIDPNEGDPKKKMKKDFLYYARTLFSCAAVIFSGIFIGKGLALGQTNATTGVGWEDLPAWAAIVVSIFFIFMLACAEGVQVSAIMLQKTKTSDFKKRAPLAYRTTQLLFAGRNMQAFLVGRQFLTAMNMVLLARVTSYAGSDGILEGDSTDDWGMGTGFNEGLLQTGFLGAILVVNVAQLASQVLASIFPIAFINNHFINWIVRLMLLVEFIGFVNACWPIAWALNSILGLKPDPFAQDPDVRTPAHDILERKKSMGIPVTKGVSPFDLDQPEREFHIDYTYKVSYI